MRKVILNLALSLDSLIEGPNGEYDWCFTDQDYGITDFLNRIDAIFFGRKSYESLISIDNNAYPDKKKYVFSKTLKTVGKQTTLISENLETEVKNIKNQSGKDIWLFGGANLTTTFINSGLVDELMLSVHPLLLGQGKHLFKDIKSRVNLKLKDAKAFSTGLVQLYYQFDNK
jgi:dihydrofolate reductase